MTSYARGLSALSSCPGSPRRTLPLALARFARRWVGASHTPAAAARRPTVDAKDYLRTGTRRRSSRSTSILTGQFRKRRSASPRAGRTSRASSRSRRSTPRRVTRSMPRGASRHTSRATHLSWWPAAATCISRVTCPRRRAAKSSAWTRCRTCCRCSPSPRGRRAGGRDRASAAHPSGHRRG